MILQVNKDTKDVGTKKRYEDHIEISIVREMEDFVVAQINTSQIHLFFDKKFKEEYDDYNKDNQDFLIHSVYLLNDTGRTIKKLI